MVMTATQNKSPGYESRATKTIKPDEAAAELARRELARRRLRWFGDYIYPWWRPGSVHELICTALEDVYKYIASGGTEGEGALIVEMPPQHGKTTITSRLFPAWLLGKLPDSNVILTAYAADLAQDNSREIRQIVTGTRFKGVFGEKSATDAPVMLSDDSAARANWKLAEPHRGGVIAVGVGGGTTGRAADLIVVDDPFKNREEAESPQERSKKIKWLTSSVYSRMRKGSAIVIIHTRWHREDVIGEVLRAMASNPQALKYKVLSLPAFPLESEELAKNEEEQQQAMMDGLYRPLQDPLEREPGSFAPLWEEEFPRATLEQIRITLEASGQLSDWYALYQQQPRNEAGEFFSRSDFEVIERAPDGLRWVRYNDLALSEKKTADWNTSVATAMDKEGTVYLRDMVRVKGWTEFKERLKTLMLMAEEVGTTWGIEDVAFQALAFQELARERELARVSILPIRPNGDKVSRARPLQARGKSGKLKLVKGPWVETFIQECLDFPNGRHDDQVDTASGGLQMIADLSARVKQPSISRPG